MNLPNYFIADLPPEASVTPLMVQEACQALKRNRALYLATRSTRSVIHLLTQLAKEWLNPQYRFRKIALSEGPEATGFSSATLENGLERFFKSLTPEAFEALLEQELGHPERLEQIVSSQPEQKTQRAAIAVAPEFLVHIAAGSLPIPALMSMVMGLLIRSAQFVKCASRGAFVPRLFAHSLYDAEPKLGACLELASWKGGNELLEQALFAEADCVTATGADDTLAQIRQRLPTHVRFLGYGLRVSFAFVAHEMLSGFHGRKIAERLSRDIAAWNQLGCLSPHLVYVQSGGTLGADQFAQLLAESLAEQERCEPRGEAPIEVGAGIAARRSLYELRGAQSPDTRVWASAGSTAWTVVYEADPRFQVSCLNRFVYVKPVGDLSEAMQSADSIRNKVSTVGLAVPEHKAHEMATQLARWGASRVCPVGQMQDPPLTWRHDGRPSLGDLVRWTDWEQ